MVYTWYCTLKNLQAKRVSVINVEVIMSVCKNMGCEDAGWYYMNMVVLMNELQNNTNNTKGIILCTQGLR